jgi:hypothetical protein
MSKTITMIPNLKILTIASMSFFASCASSTKTGSNTHEANTSRDGSSIEKAIVVNSVSAEYAYVRKICPECKMKRQVLTSRDKKHYDVLYFDKSGTEVIYYFDINSFFGKSF